ncbi:hypothetical protein JRY13_08815, partial [Lacticaseibacillus paracasei]|uniref:hypothetical protein n=1 Tax=Lacticaseibacillus paracasei TaxID=1597 RepID=UPI00194E6885
RPCQKTTLIYYHKLLKYVNNFLNKHATDMNLGIGYEFDNGEYIINFTNPRQHFLNEVFLRI